MLDYLAFLEILANSFFMVKGCVVVDSSVASSVNESYLCYFFLLQVQGEIQEIVKTGLWVGDCFIYTSSVNRLNYYVGGEIVTIAHLDRYKMQPFLLEILKCYERPPTCDNKICVNPAPPPSCRTMYLLGYIPKDDRLYLGDKELNIVSYSLLVSVLEYQTAVMRRDFGMADKVLPTIPKEQRTRVAHFLEKQVS